MSLLTVSSQLTGAGAADWTQFCEFPSSARRAGGHGAEQLGQAQSSAGPSSKQQ